MGRPRWRRALMPGPGYRRCAVRIACAWALSSHISQRPDPDWRRHGSDRAPAVELGRAQMPDAAEHAGDAPARPPQRVLDVGEGARVIGRCGKCVEQGAHEVAAAVVKPLDVAGVVHGVLGSVLGDGAGAERDIETA